MRKATSSVSEKSVLNRKGDDVIRSLVAKPASSKGHRVNEDIEASAIRLIDSRGEMVGVVSVNEALTAAQEAGLDLVEVSPNADPPVCKILDYGKYKYEEQKRLNLARKKQKTIDVKEIKLRPSIDRHDYDVKMRSAEKFLKDGDKVKLTMRFRGREMAHRELGVSLLKKVQDDLEALGRVEQLPQLEGRQMIMVMAPR